MLKKWSFRVMLVLAVAIMVSGLASCSSSNDGNPQTAVKQVMVDVQVAGDTVIIPLNEVTEKLNTRFNLVTEEGDMTFMAYILDGKPYLRADICPPCRSRSFTLTESTLVCDACGTVFDAATGKGISGACVAYPKQSAPYQLLGESIVVSQASLAAAYKDTLKPN